MPEGLDWYLWRIASSKRFTAQPWEIAEKWSLGDVLDAHDVLDMFDELEQKHADRAAKAAKAPSN